jgi:hypothetical protein
MFNLGADRNDPLVEKLFYRSLVCLTYSWFSLLIRPQLSVAVVTGLSGDT